MGGEKQRSLVSVGKHALRVWEDVDGGFLLSLGNAIRFDLCRLGQGEVHEAGWLTSPLGLHFGVPTFFSGIFPGF
jgi:hypothetical protein